MMTPELNEKVQILTGRFYQLGQQYFEGIKGRDIPKWEEELEDCIATYEDLREEAIGQ